MSEPWLSNVFKNLKMLNASNNQLTHVRHAHLSTMANLKVLDLDNNPLHCDEGFKALIKWLTDRKVKCDASILNKWKDNNKYSVLQVIPGNNHVGFNAEMKIKGAVTESVHNYSWESFEHNACAKASQNYVITQETASNTKNDINEVTDDDSESASESESEEDESGEDTEDEDSKEAEIESISVSKSTTSSTNSNSNSKTNEIVDQIDGEDPEDSDDDDDEDDDDDNDDEDDTDDEIELDGDKEINVIKDKTLIAEGISVIKQCKFYFLFSIFNEIDFYIKIFFIYLQLMSNLKVNDIAI